MNKCPINVIGFRDMYIQIEGNVHTSLPWLRAILNNKHDGNTCNNCENAAFCNARVNNAIGRLIPKMTQDEYKEILARDTDTVKDFREMVE